jgi:hypothetical protein
MAIYFVGDRVYFNHRGTRCRGVVVRMNDDAITIEYAEPGCSWYEFVRIRRDAAAAPQHDVILASPDPRCVVCGAFTSLIGTDYYCLPCEDKRESEQTP